MNCPHCGLDTDKSPAKLALLDRIAKLIKKAVKVKRYTAIRKTKDK